MSITCRRRRKELLKRFNRIIKKIKRERRRKKRRKQQSSKFKKKILSRLLETKSTIMERSIAKKSRRVLLKRPSTMLSAYLPLSSPTKAMSGKINYSAVLFQRLSTFSFILKNRCWF